MENKKLFIGNLIFECIEDDLKALLSPYGTVISVKQYRKKGYALVEMANEAEAQAVMRRLDQRDFRGRPLRINIELPPKKAKALTIKSHWDRKKSFSQETKTDQPKKSSRNQAEERYSVKSDRPKHGTKEGHRNASGRPTRDRLKDSLGNVSGIPDHDRSRKPFRIKSADSSHAKEFTGNRRIPGQSHPDHAKKDFRKTSDRSLQEGYQDGAPRLSHSRVKEGFRKTPARPAQEQQKSGYRGIPGRTTRVRPRENTGIGSNQPERENVQTGLKKVSKRPPRGRVKDKSKTSKTINQGTHQKKSP